MDITSFVTDSARGKDFSSILVNSLDKDIAPEIVLPTMLDIKNIVTIGLSIDGDLSTNPPTTTAQYDIYMIIGIPLPTTSVTVVFEREKPRSFVTVGTIF
mmetsp:Transcript_25625/g.29572  ORF Transcript_25625/g.29572 Transcript_25625/m.29572 type:complete len:100 (-) Transcript_25625:29-328(-)